MVANSSPSRRAIKYNKLGQVVRTHVPLSPSSNLVLANLWHKQTYHAMHYSRVSMVSQCKLVSVWVLQKRCSVSPRGPCGLGRNWNIYTNWLWMRKCLYVWYAAGSGVLQGALCGLASYFPSKYMQAEMTGQVSVCLLCRYRRLTV